MRTSIEILREYGDVSIEDLRRREILRKIAHGDEGLNSWFDLYHVTKIEDTPWKCECGEKVAFLLHEHLHTNDEFITLSCFSCAPSSYFTHLNDRTAG